MKNIIKNMMKSKLLGLTILLMVSAATTYAQDRFQNNEELLVAAEQGNLLAVQRLIDGGVVDVNTVNNLGETPLHLASGDGYDEIIEALVNNGANIDVVDNHGDTPLHCAAADGHIEAVRVLLHVGANTGIVNNDQKTPLDLAIECGHEVVKIELQRE